MPARSGKKLGKTSIWQKLVDMLPKRARVADDPVASLIRSRPKGEKSHSWLTYAWAIGIILLLVITFVVLYYVLIAPMLAYNNQQNNEAGDDATSSQSSSSPDPIQSTNPTYEVGFF